MTKKILVLDSGDILCQKDLSEIYFYNIEDNYFGWILELGAGNYLKFTNKLETNNFYLNSGVFLVNIRLFRKDELYKKAVFVSKSYHNFICPTQEILVSITNYKFKFFPLNYNIYLFYNLDKDRLNKRKIASIKKYLNLQKLAPYKYTFDEIYDAMTDPVILHFNFGKIMYQSDCNKYVFQWIKYAKITKKYNNLKLKYSRPFQCERYNLNDKIL